MGSEWSSFYTFLSIPPSPFIQQRSASQFSSLQLKIASFDALLPNAISGATIGAQAAPQAPSTGVQKNIGAPGPVTAADFDLFAFPAATFAVPQAPAVVA
ncbi:hypothetical protein M422DRAFT_265441, partial [Sphaerobolus stellatus SS14]